MAMMKPSDHHKSKSVLNSLELSIPSSNLIYCLFIVICNDHKGSVLRYYHRALVIKPDIGYFDVHKSCPYMGKN